VFVELRCVRHVCLGDGGVLVVDLDPDPGSVVVSQHQHGAKAVDDGVRHEFTDQQLDRVGEMLKTPAAAPATRGVTGVGDDARVRSKFELFVGIRLLSLAVAVCPTPDAVREHQHCYRERQLHGHRGTVLLRHRAVAISRMATSPPPRCATSNRVDTADVSAETSTCAAAVGVVWARERRNVPTTPPRKESSTRVVVQRRCVRKADYRALG
jgi:hypothetical protein